MQQIPFMFLIDMKFIELKLRDGLCSSAFLGKIGERMDRIGVPCRTADVANTSTKQPKTGPIGQTKMIDVLFFLVFNVIIEFYGVLIIPKWLINDS